jgi:Glutathione S-transferase N-terminal domain
MLTLYSYPELFGVADNNGYGLKVFAFLRLAGVPFRHEHIFDASSAPRGQLPYIVDDGETIGDSDTIIAHLVRKYRLTIDERLTGAERDTDHLVTRMLDDLYWVMSYSRWKDERFWPLFRDALMREHPSLTPEGPGKAREFNAQRYHFQGIGRFAMLPTPPTNADLRICRCWRTCCLRAAICTARRRPASTPVSMASSPISISSTLIRRSNSSSPPAPTSCAIATRSMRR